LNKTWEKLLLAARAIVAVEHPSEIFVISSRPYGQRAVLKFAAYTGATPIAGRFTPGAFTNQIQVSSNLICYLVLNLPFVEDSFTIIVYLIIISLKFYEFFIETYINIC